ncbi:MAG: hypothetical protein QXP01_03520 [Candidatus Hadarchaeum sp.]
MRLIFLALFVLCLNIDVFNRAGQECAGCYLGGFIKLVNVLYNKYKELFVNEVISSMTPPVIISRPEIIIIIIELVARYGEKIINGLRELFKSSPGMLENSTRRGRLEANREKIGEWEEFKVVKNDDGTFSFVTHTGFLCAECGGCGEVVADRLKIGEWEKWKMIRHDDGTVSLCTLSGYYLCAENDGRIVANRQKIGPWEKFTLIVDFEKKTCAFKCWHGKFISAQP